MTSTDKPLSWASKVAASAQPTSSEKQTNNTNQASANSGSAPQTAPATNSQAKPGNTGNSQSHQQHHHQNNHPNRQNSQRGGHGGRGRGGNSSREGNRSHYHNGGHAVNGGKSEPATAAPQTTSTSSTATPAAATPAAAAVPPAQPAQKVVSPAPTPQPSKPTVMSFAKAAAAGVSTQPPQSSSTVTSPTSSQATENAAIPEVTATSSTEAAQDQPKEAPHSVEKAESAVQFRGNIAPPSVNKPKVKFGMQPASAGPSHPPSVAANAQAQHAPDAAPVAPLPVRQGSQLSDVSIPRTASAPPKMDKDAAPGPQKQVADSAQSNAATSAPVAVAPSASSNQSEDGTGQPAVFVPHTAIPPHIPQNISHPHLPGQPMPYQPGPFPFAVRPHTRPPPPGTIPPQNIPQNPYQTLKTGYKQGMPPTFNQGIPPPGTPIPIMAPPMAPGVPPQAPYYYTGPFPAYGFDPQNQFAYPNQFYPQPMGYPAAMMRPPAGPGSIPPNAQAQRFPPPAQAPGQAAPFVPASTAPAIPKTPSKAIKIVNPNTKQEVNYVKNDMSPASTPGTLVATPASSTTAPSPTPSASSLVSATPGKLENPPVVTAPIPEPAATPQPQKVKGITFTDKSGNKIEFHKSSKPNEVTVEVIAPAGSTPSSRAASPVRKEASVDGKGMAERPASPALAPETAKASERTRSPAKARSPSPAKAKAATPKAKSREPSPLPAPKVEDTVTSSPAVTEPEEIKEATPDVASPAKPEGPIKRHILKDFSVVTYPLGVSPPTINNKSGFITYTLELLKMLNMAEIPAPSNLSKVDAPTEDTKATSRGPRPPSVPGGYHGGGSGSGQFQGKRPQAGAPGSYLKGFMPTMPPPSTNRGPGGRNSVGPGAAPGGRSGGQGSYDGKQNQGLPPRPGAGRGNRSSYQQQPPPEPVENLKIGANAWTPDTIKKKKVIYESEEARIEAEEGEVVKKAKGLLNKLTVEKFDTISEQFLGLPISNPSILRKVINEIFVKALDEHHFQKMYAQFCLRLSTELPKVQSWFEQDHKTNAFRRLLLNKCQEEFEKAEKWHKEDDADKLSREERFKKFDSMTPAEKEAYAEEQYQRDKTKRRVLGNISFIGELFNVAMITEKIMHSCVKQLMENVTNPEEEETESLCKLLTRIGEKLDHEKAKSHMDTYFARIHEMATNTSLGLPSRIRFMLHDLIDLRKNKWKARIETVGPATIAEIRALEEKKKQEEEEAMRKRDMASNRGRGGGGRGGGRPMSMGGPPQQNRGGAGGNSQDARNDGWNTVDRSKASPRIDDNYSNFGKVDARRQSFLGPPSGAWGKGAGASTTPKEKPSTPPVNSAVNKFSLLDSDSSEKKERQRSASRDSKGTGRAADKPVADATPEKIEQFSQKVNSIIEDFFSSYVVEEAIDSIKDLSAEGLTKHIVREFITRAFEKKLDIMQRTAKLVAGVYKEGLFNDEGWGKIIEPIIENLPDLAVDIPAVFTYFGTFFGHLIVAGNATETPSHILELLSTEVETRSRIPPVPKFIAEVLTVIKNESGEDAVVEFVGDFDLLQFWPSAQRSGQSLAEWTEKNKFGFLGSQEQQSDVKSVIASGSVDQILKFVESMDEKSRTSAKFVREVSDQILEFIGAKTIFADGSKKPDPSSRDLFIKMDERIKSFKPVFVSLLVSKELEVEVLLACQAYWAQHGQIEDILHHLFRMFISNNDIVSEDAAFLWKKDTTGESSSKKAALHELNNYLKSLSQ